MVTCHSVDCCGWHLRTWNIATFRNPSPRDDRIPIGIGDVGFIRDGRFTLSFSAGSPLGQRKLGDQVPPTFKPFNVETPVSLEPRPPGCLHTTTIRPLGSSSSTPMFTPYVPSFEPSSTIFRKYHPGSWDMARIFYSSSPAIVVQHW